MTDKQPKPRVFSSMDEYLRAFPQPKAAGSKDASPKTLGARIAKEVFAKVLKADYKR